MASRKRKSVQLFGESLSAGTTDRTIVATALMKNVAVLTKDDTMRHFKGVRTIW